ncbi:hypothetical protein UY3_06396 [Chelonia mydas]|uniref:Uncharacterized protein n=1 Tax=Chelonia mydas TaxID=8469 RepID=M7BGT1_CHEMY|nr:hypothetical protein UY3_06396 [Chelonia mydas]
MGTQVGTETVGGPGTGISIETGAGPETRITPGIAQGVLVQGDPRKPEGQEDPVSPQASSSSFLDEGVAGISTTLPAMDNREHQQFLRRVAQNLSMQSEKVLEKTDPMVDILVPEGPSRLCPLLRLSITPLRCGKHPPLFSPTVKGVERKYIVPSKGYEYLFTHLQPGTLVVGAANQKERQGQVGLTHKSKEAKKLDFFSRKVYCTAGLQLRIANEQAVFSLYSCNSLNMLSKFQELLLADSHLEFVAVLEEGKVVTGTSLQASLDSVESATRTMATAIAVRRSSWLQVSGLSQKVQHTIQDLPFDCSRLFSEQKLGPTA